jgi:chitodextrinase
LPQVYALTTSGITASSATLNSGISGFSEYEFNYRVVGIINWTAGTSTSGSLNVTGLSASTNYEFRVRVKCPDGSFSDWTGNQPFSTTGTGPGNTCALPQVYALTTSNITKTGANLNSGITATGFKNFEFNYRKEGIATWTSSISTNASINVTGLTQSTRYEFQVRVQCSNDVWSDWTTSVFFTTLGDVNPPPPGQTQLFISKTQASAGDTALVTIQANNFKDIGGFQFSVSIPSQKARIVGVDQAKSFAGLQMRQVDPYRWGFIWFDPNLVAKTLPDGAVLITLKVVFNVELSPNECIPITFDSNPTEIAATTLINQIVGEFIPTTTNGELCLVSRATISGTIKNTSGLGINQVKVNIGNGVVYTDGNGKYALPNLSVISSYTISPSKTGAPKNGVNVVDIVTIRQHILGDKIFDTPFKYIASDVNFSGSVNVVDVVLIQQLILGQVDSLSRNWVFIPAGYTFASPASAIKDKYPEIVSYSKLPGDLTQDFIGVKIGDANHSASVKNRWQNKPGLQIPALNLPAGETLEVPVYAWNLEQIQGFQVQLFADPQALQLKGIELPQGGILTLNNFDLRSLDQGEIKILWVQALSAQVAALPKDQALFYLKIQAKTNMQLSRELSIKEEDFENLFANQDLDWTSGVLFFNQNLQLEPAPALGIKHLIVPNPSFGVSPVLQIETAQSGAYQVVITDVMGRVVKTLNANAVPGINRETLLNLSTTAQGVYHYRVLLNGQVLVGKFLLTNGN